MQAEQLILREIDTHARLGRSFAFETTLAGRRYARSIRERHANGYRDKLVFLASATRAEGLAKIRVRVHQGGRAVPESAIRRRFDAR